MTTPQSIEQIVEECIKRFGDNITAATPWGVQKVEDDIECWLRTTLTTYGAAREAKGREEAVRVLDTTTLPETSEGMKYIKGANDMKDAIRIALTPPPQTDNHTDV